MPVCFSVYYLTTNVRRKFAFSLRVRAHLHVWTSERASTRMRLSRGRKGDGEMRRARIYGAKLECEWGRKSEAVTCVHICEVIVVTQHHAIDVCPRAHICTCVDATFIATLECTSYSPLNPDQNQAKIVISEALVAVTNSSWLLAFKIFRVFYANYLLLLHFYQPSPSALRSSELVASLCGGFIFWCYRQAHPLLCFAATTKGHQMLPPSHPNDLSHQGMQWCTPSLWSSLYFWWK